MRDSCARARTGVPETGRGGGGPHVRGIGRRDTNGFDVLVNRTLANRTRDTSIAGEEAGDRNAREMGSSGNIVCRIRIDCTGTGLEVALGSDSTRVCTVHGFKPGLQADCGVSGQ